MKIHLITYNKDSILNNGFARSINGFVLFILFLGPTMNESPTTVPMNILELLFVVIGTALITWIFTTEVNERTTFYEWDYTERQKKKRFLSAYNIYCVALSCSLCLSICFAIKCFKSEALDDVPVVRYGSLFPPLFFIFNLFNIPSLYNLKEDLRHQYKIQKKPANWQDCGKEVTDDDLVNEIHRDTFGYEL